MKSLIKGIFWVLFLYALAGYLATKIAHAEVKPHPEQGCQLKPDYVLVKTIFAETSKGNVYHGWLVMPKENLLVCFSTIGRLDVLCYQDTPVMGYFDGDKSMPIGRKLVQWEGVIPPEKEFCEIQS